MNNKDEHQVDFGNCACGTKAIAKMGLPGKGKPLCTPCLEATGIGRNTEMPEP